MSRKPTCFLLVLVAIVALSGFPAAAFAGGLHLGAAAVGGSQAATVRADTDWGRMPLYFIPNRGQTDSAVAYYVAGADKTVYFTPQGLTFQLAAGDGAAAGSYAVKLDFVGASATTPAGHDPTGAVVSYFTGPDGAQRTGLPTYTTLSYAGLWPGIDLAYSGSASTLKHEFIVGPGADPSQIRLAYRGATVTRNAEGQLVIATPGASFIDDAPVAYQEVGGKRVPVDGWLRARPERRG